MQTENAAVDKSKLFAVRIIRLFKYLVDDKRENVLSN